MNKKILTRRDITLNRIIMNNIVKDNIGESTENLAGLKLEFWLDKYIHNKNIYMIYLLIKIFITTIILYYIHSFLYKFMQKM